MQRRQALELYLDLVDTLILDTGLKFYAAPSPPLTNLDVKSRILKFYVKVWSGYLMNLFLDLDTLHGVSYWSKLPYPHTLNDLEVKATDLEFFMFNEMFISHQSVIRKH